jgi:Asp/Glu/hydantoin racemase
MQPDNQGLLGGKEEDIFPLLLSAARQCIEEDGAQVILLGSTTMHQAHTYLSEHLNVPIINPGPVP